MAKRGPKPNSPATAKLRGHAGKRKPRAKPSATVIAHPGELRMPAWLSPDAKRAWSDVVALLEPSRELLPGDVFALSCLCQAWAELRIATELLDRDGRIVMRPIQTSRGEHLADRHEQHPAVAVQQQAMLRIKTFAVEFKLTPASRNAPNGGPKPDDDDPLPQPGKEATLASFIRTASQ